MKRPVLCIGISALCMALAAAPRWTEVPLHAATPQENKDKIIWRDEKKPPTLGKITKETYSNIEFVTTTGSKQSQLNDTVKEVEYYDAKGAFKKLMDHLKAQEFDSALELAETLPGDNSLDKTWRVQYGLYYAGYCYYQKGDWPNAVKKFEELRTQVPDSKFLKEAFVHAFRAYRRWGNAEGAKTTLQTFEKESRAKGLGVVDMEFLKAELAEASGDYKTALELYGKHRSSPPPRGDEAKIGEFRCLVITKNDAEQLANSLIKDKNAPDHVRFAALNARGAEYLRKNRIEMAEEDFLRVVLGEQGDPFPGSFEYEYSSYGMIKILAIRYASADAEKKKALAKKADDLFRGINNPTLKAEAKKEIDRMK